MTIVNLQERAVIRKDFHEVWDLKMARDTLLIVPLLLVIVLPVAFVAALINIPQSQFNGADQMMKMLPLEAKGLNFRQASLYVMTNFLFPLFFLMIPLMVSSVSAASSFVGEKERGTLETLLLTPMSLRQIFKAKVLGCILLSAIVTFSSFVMFAIVISVGDIFLKMPLFFNWKWFVLVLFLAPSITVFGVVFMVLVSSKSKSYIESIQTSGYIILPLVLLFVGEIAGLFTLNVVSLLIISTVMILLDAIIWNMTARSFQTEKLLQ